MTLSNQNFSELNKKVSLYIQKDAPVSSHIVVIHKNDATFYMQTTKKFIAILQKIALKYTEKIVSKEFSKIVRLLERNVPPELISYIRKIPPFLNFTRLDFQGRYIIEYNSSPGFLLLTSIVDRSCKELGFYEKR
jgi:hypothetical protein